MYGEALKRAYLLTKEDIAFIESSMKYGSIPLLTFRRVISNAYKLIAETNRILKLHGTLDEDTKRKLENLRKQIDHVNKQMMEISVLKATEQARKLCFILPQIEGLITEVLEPSFYDILKQLDQFMEPWMRSLAENISARLVVSMPEEEEGKRLRLR